MTSIAPDTATATSSEREDLVALLNKARFFLRFTVRGLTDEQAGQRPTASELCLGGLIKHVASVERNWVDVIVEGRSLSKDFEDMTQADFQQRADEFQILPGETLDTILAEYEEIAARTDDMVATVDLNAAWPLPKAPWFTEDSWSTRRVLMHILAETSQHCGHADIIREALDGQKTMG